MSGKQEWKVPCTSFERKLSKKLTKAGVFVECGVKLHGYYPDIRVCGTNILVEVDGGYHFEPHQKKADAHRTEILESYGYKVLRFTNNQVKFHIAEVIWDIKEAAGIPNKELRPGQAAKPKETKKSKAQISKLIGQKSFEKMMKKKANKKVKADKEFSIESYQPDSHFCLKNWHQAEQNQIKGLIRLR